MPLEFAREQPDAQSLIADALDRVLARPSPISAMDLAAEPLEVGQPHPVYDLSAEDIANGRGLDAARLTGERYIVGTPGAAVAAGELVPGGPGGAPELANLNYGRFVQGTVDALGRLEQLDEVKSHDYEVRVLRSAAVFLFAIWLKPKSGRPDILYPLDPAPPPLEALRPYAPEAVLEAVAPIAQRRVDEPGPPAVP